MKKEQTKVDEVQPRKPQLNVSANAEIKMRAKMAALVEGLTLEAWVSKVVDEASREVLKKARPFNYPHNATSDADNGIVAVAGSSPVDSTNQATFHFPSNVTSLRQQSAHHSEQNLQESKANILKIHASNNGGLHELSNPANGCRAVDRPNWDFPQRAVAA